jgi:hypothetical protein
MQAHINLFPLLLHSLTCCELVQQHQVVQLVLANHPPPSHNANVTEPHLLWIGPAVQGRAAGTPLVSPRLYQARLSG